MRPVWQVRSTTHHAAVAIPALILLLASVGCNGDATGDGGDHAFAPTTPAILSVDNPGKDEDPSVVRAKDGTIFVAWFSDRTGSGDIYVTRIRRATAWQAPVRVSHSQDGEFNRHLIQSDDGTFHLTWFRWSAPFRGHIMYNHSADGITWDPANEVQVTSAADVDDWVPTIAQAPDGALLIYFASALRTPAHTITDLYVARRPPGQENWTSPVPVAGLNDPVMNDHLPYAARIDDHIALVWVRHDTTEALPWLNHKSDVYYATSSNGLTWTEPVRVTRDAGNIVNLFPSLYQRETGNWMISWLSTREGPNPRVYQIPAASAQVYPLGVSRIGAVGDGYSHKLVLTSTNGVYLAVWVFGAEGSQDVYYRFFEP